MKSNVIKIDFNNAVALNMDDKVSLRDIHAKLVEKGGLSEKTDFSDWVKDKLKFYPENQPDGFYREKTEKLGRGRPTYEYLTTVQVAMEILANGHGQVGHDMRRFMSECVRKVVENKIELPFDINDRLSILQYATEAIREVTEKLNAETQLRLVTEERLKTEQKRWEHIEEVGTRIGSSEFLKNNVSITCGTGRFKVLVRSLTAICKRICVESGIDLITMPSDFGTYYVFPDSVLRKGLEILKNHYQN